jgi:hypothetical protein
MYCSYHPASPAVVKCNHCARALCPACDHRIRGFPYCQNCIVAGVEALQHQARLDASYTIRQSSSPIAAGFLSVIMPGLGAAYNGQMSKAVVQFALFASFFQLVSINSSVPLILAIFCTYLFSIVDSYRTAQLVRAGLALSTEKDAIARRLYGNPLAWGVVLTILGITLLLHTYFNIKPPIKEIVPIALVALGGYMIFDYSRRFVKQKRETPEFDRQQPPSVVSAPLLGSERAKTNEFTTQVSVRVQGNKPPYGL